MGNSFLLVTLTNSKAIFVFICCALFSAVALAVYLYLAGKFTLPLQSADSRGIQTAGDKTSPSVSDGKSSFFKARKIRFGDILFIVFLLAAVIRLIMAFCFRGHGDITYFNYWTRELKDNGLLNYYDKLKKANGSAGDNSYLPLYLYILYVIAGITKLFNLNMYTAGFYALLKIPSIICDLYCAYLIYRFASKRTKKEYALGFSLVYLFNPAVFLNSSLWGQVDSFIALFTVLSLKYLFEKKFYRAFAFIAAGLTFKLQFAFILPVIGIFVLMVIIEYIKVKDYKNLRAIGYSVLIFFGTFIAICLPFTIKYMLQGKIFFIYEVYFGQVETFNYYVLNTFNFYSLLGLNWAALPESILFENLNMNLFNYILIALMSLFAMVAYILGKNKKNIFLLSAWLILCIFTFSLKMHERYMYAALAPLLIACVVYKDKSLYLSFVFFSILQFLNSGVLLFCKEGYYTADDKFLVFFSLLWVLYFLYFTGVVVYLMTKTRKTEGLIAEENTKIPFAAVKELTPTVSWADYNKSAGNYVYAVTVIESEKEKLIKKTAYYDNIYKKRLEERKELKFRKIEILIMAVFFAVYFLVNMINLGSVNVPQTYWEVTSSDSGYNYKQEFILLEIPQGTVTGEIWGYKGIDINDNPRHNIRVYAADSVDAADYSDILKESNLKGSKNVCNNGDNDLNAAQMYKWFEITVLNKEYRYIAFTVNGTGVRINEIVLLEKDTRNIIDYNILYASLNSDHSALNAFDERATYPGYNSLMTDMYFDEIYHARTAYEHINGWTPYEITHPPLGKIIISVGIRIFGMNPFGWRIMGVLFASMLLPVLYLLGKELFKKRKWAVIFTLLASVEGLHFVQGRIATIDTYIVFFSSLSMLFMVRFFKTNILRDKLIKCLIPFALSGIFFGLAVSSKWTGMYTGAGLFVLFIIYLFRTLNEYRYRAALLEAESDCAAYGKYSKNLNIKLIYLFLSGIIFFLMIPFATYLLSYLPYMVEGETRNLFQVMLKNQEYMYYYHSVWVANSQHQCASAWYTWLINYKSVYMYLADSSYGSDVYARIHSMGNPVISLFGAISLIVSLYYVFKNPFIKILNGITMVKKNYLYGKKTGKVQPLEEERFAQKFGTRKIPEDVKGLNLESILIIMIGFFSALLPWMFVERTTFIYHFYPAMPYYIAMSVYVLMKVCEKENAVVSEIKLFSKKITMTKGGRFTALYVALAVLMFIMFFPVYTGLPVSKSLANVLFLWYRLFTGSVGF